MKNRDETIEKYCKYCEMAQSLYDKDSMLCVKHGVVSAGGHCRGFSYDPLKREPKRKKEAEPLEYIEV